MIDDPLNPIELKAFRSVNSSIGWIGISASPFCYVCKHIATKSSKTLVRDLVTQLNSIRLLQKLGGIIRYTRPKNGQYVISVLVFSDASRTGDHGKLSYISGLLFGDIEQGSIFHTLSSSSHKSKRPVKSISSAETLAAGEALDEGKMLFKAFENLLGVQIGLYIIVDSKDLFTTLSTCHNATDRSIRADVSVMIYEFDPR